MKKLVTVIFAVSAAFCVKAQLANTQWKTRIAVDGGHMSVIFDFKKDTCRVLRLADSSAIETMSWSLADGLLTLKKIEGESDCDETTIGKYKAGITPNALALHMVSDDCSDRSDVMDNSNWVAWKIPAEIMLDDATLKQYAGTYQLDEAHPIYVTVENGRLYAEGPNNGLPKSPLAAETNTRFFIKIAGVEWDFVKDATGKVTGVISHEEQDFELKKVK